MAKTIKAEAKKPGIFRRMGAFFAGSYSELQKVIWPTRAELVKQVMIVIGLCAACTLIVALLDLVFVNITSFLTTLGS